MYVREVFNGVNFLITINIIL